jgi:hypothetical protein
MGNKYEKQQLEICLYAKDAAEYGQADTAGVKKKLDRVTVKNLSLAHDDPLYGKMIEMAIFSESVKGYVSGLGKGARFFADVEERMRDNERLSYSIYQVYDEAGQPVAAKKGGKGGGGSWGKSTETVAMEIDAKWRNTALMQAVDRANAFYQSTGKTDSDDDIIIRAEKYYKWLAGGKTAAVPRDKELHERERLAGMDFGYMDKKNITMVKAPAGNPPAVVTKPPVQNNPEDLKAMQDILKGSKPAATALPDKDKDWERMGEERKVIEEIDQQLRDAAIQQRYNTTEIQAHIFEKYGENDTKHLTYEQKKELVKDLKLGKVTRQKAPKQ